jgi:DNA-binding CsgD family transcriptional regulator
LKAVHQLRSGDPRHASADFPVARTSGAPPYLVSVRPIPSNHRNSRLAMAADAIVFIRDPLSRNTAAIRLLREVFGLTDAEASLAQALQSGISPGDYAQARAVSLNTVYTHLRRIKEKTGCNRMGELTRKLNDLQVPLRID